nr:MULTISPECIES: hypothetical protein [unclassified Arthrobacter]
MITQVVIGVVDNNIENDPSEKLFSVCGGIFGVLIDDVQKVKIVAMGAVLSCSMVMAET